MPSERETTLNQKFYTLLDQISDMDDVAALRNLADAARSTLGELAGGLLLDGNLRNPFFAPHDAAIPRETVAKELAQAILSARVAAAEPARPNILVACAPKSGSTFISAMLAQSLKLPVASLTFTSGSSTLFSQTYLREQELDELAVLNNGVRGGGYVAQHHIRCTPYLCRQMQFYNIRPIVTHRNVLDCLVSMDDMFIAWRDGDGTQDTKYFRDALPAGFTGMNREDRLVALAHRHVPWYLQFYMSWKKCEAMGLVKPLWISYEDDFLGDKHGLAKRLAAYIGPQHANAADIAARLADTRDGARLRLNKGEAGRGRDVPGRVRAIVREIFAAYAEDLDFTALIGPAEAAALRSGSKSDVIPFETSVRARTRAEQKGQRPAIIWLTGLSGAGKSTVADALDRLLSAAGKHTYVLDGDNMRLGLNGDLGFSESDRVENIRRVGEVAKLMHAAGLIVIVCLISPFREDRARARSMVPEGDFIEVFVDTPLDECVARDPKGLYRRAIAGDIPNFTGISARYEAPEQPDIHLDTLKSTPLELALQIEMHLHRRDQAQTDGEPPMVESLKRA